MVDMGGGDSGTVGLRRGVFALAKAEGAKEIAVLGIRNQFWPMKDTFSRCGMCQKNNLLAQAERNPVSPLIRHKEVLSCRANGKSN